jgi:hypothetical protein
MDSPLHAEVRLLFERRPAATGSLAHSHKHYLTFLGAYLRERCTRLSEEEKQKIQAYIDQQESLAVELRDKPWSLKDDDETDPLLRENKYIQAYVSPLDPLLNLLTA